MNGVLSTVFCKFVKPQQHEVCQTGLQITWQSHFKLLPATSYQTVSLVSGYWVKNMLNPNNDIVHLGERSRGFLFDPSFLDIEASDAVAIEARYRLSAFCPSLFARLGISRPASLNRAVPKRQAEFLAGRLLAQAALQLLRQPTTSIAIGRHRSPVWPRGLSGSISHTEGRCISVLVLDENAKVGVDIEKIASGGSLEAILERTLETVERDLIADQNVFDVNLLASIAFSAKETLFKALYPIVGDYFDFCAAHLVSVNSRNELCLQLTRALHMSLPADSRFLVRFSIAESFVRTWLICRTDHIPGQTAKATSGTRLSRF